MTDLSANYGFPSPSGNEAPQGPYAIKALSDAVDAALATAARDYGWVNIGVNSGFAAQGAQIPQVRRVGKFVHAHWGWSSTGLAINNTYTVGSVPVGYRPIVDTEAIAAVSSSGQAVGHFFVTTLGDVQLRTGSTLGAYYLLSSGCGWFVA